jgi:hypothetical protein
MKKTLELKWQPGLLRAGDSLNSQKETLKSKNDSPTRPVFELQEIRRKLVKQKSGK